jgi:hypothetical protein
MVCFRYIIVNTLHKGDNKDDDDNNNNNNLMVACSKQYMFSKAPPPPLLELRISPSSCSGCLVCSEVRASTAFCFCWSLSRHSVALVPTYITVCPMAPTCTTRWKVENSALCWHVDFLNVHVNMTMKTLTGSVQERGRGRVHEGGRLFCPRFGLSFLI